MYNANELKFSKKGSNLKDEVKAVENIIIFDDINLQKSNTNSKQKKLYLYLVCLGRELL